MKLRNRILECEENRSVFLTYNFKNRKVRINYAESTLNSSIKINNQTFKTIKMKWEELKE
jgi:hypothetical protein